jgi:hypothetical protein
MVAYETNGRRENGHLVCEDEHVPQQTTAGAEFATAFAGKDAGRMRELLHPDIDFRGMTPNRIWEASGRDAVLEVLFANWLDDNDHVESVDRIEGDTIVDRERVGYRVSVTNPEGRFLFEQQAYLSTRDGQIDWIRVVCSGLRPAP